MEGDCCESAISWSNIGCYPQNNVYEKVVSYSDTVSSGEAFCHGYNYPSTSYGLTVISSESVPSYSASSHDDADHYTLDAYSRLYSPLMYNAQIIMKRIGHFHDVPFVNPALTFGTPPLEFEVPPPKHYIRKSSIAEVNNNVISLSSLSNDTISPIRSSSTSDDFSHSCKRMPGFDGSGGRFGGEGSRFADGSRSREQYRGSGENGFNKNESDRPANRFEKGSQNTGFKTFSDNRSNDYGGSQRFNNADSYKNERPRNDLGFDNQRQREFDGPRNDRFNRNDDSNARQFDGNRHDDRRGFTPRDNDIGRFDNKKEFGRNDQDFGSRNQDLSRNLGGRFNEPHESGGYNKSSDSFNKPSEVGGGYKKPAEGFGGGYNRPSEGFGGGYKKPTEGFAGGRDDNFSRKKPEEGFRSNFGENRQSDSRGPRNNDNFTGNRDSSGFSGNRDQDGFAGALRTTGCFNCGGHGHRANECNEPRKGERSFGGGRADNGGGFGGGRSDFGGSGFGNKGGRDNDNHSGYKGSGFGKDEGFGGSRPSGCFNCGGHGHRANECSEPRKDSRGGDGGSRPSGCFNCGGHGHRANECSEPRKDSRGGGFDGGRNDFEDSGPRAPRDWAPDEENIEDLYAVDRKTIDDFDPSADSDVIISGVRTKSALVSWENSALSHQLIDILVKKMHFARPRKIQGAVIPQVLDGVDVLAQADTGSGKTLAFVLPILHMALQTPNRNSKCRPFALVVTPTRELAQQIHENFQKMGDPIRLRSVLCIGQMSGFVIGTKIREGCDVIVGTPGKMMEFICRRGDVYLSDLKIFVLDEADKMLDSNDNQHLTEIMRNKDFKNRRHNGEIQTLLFSATVSDDFKRQCNSFLRESYALVASNTQGGRSANPRVKQTYVETEDKAAKNDKLCELFDAKNPESKRLKTLIFVKRKDDCNFVAADLADSCNIPVASLSGNLPQNERSKHIKEFKNNKLTVLVATDVCARGIDIPELDRVIVFDMPDWSHKNKEEAIDVFIHRIGRTGRIKKGEAIIFIQPNTDSDFAPHLVKLCETAGQQPPEFLKNLGSGGGGFGGSGFGEGGGFGGSGFGEGGGLGGFGGDAGGNGGGFATEAANFSSGFGGTTNAPESNGFGSSQNDNSMGNAGFGEKKNITQESAGQSGFGSEDEEDNKTVRDSNHNDW